jgi:hypothetical protein
MESLAVHPGPRAVANLPLALRGGLQYGDERPAGPQHFGRRKAPGQPRPVDGHAPSSGLVTPIVIWAKALTGRATACHV